MTAPSRDLIPLKLDAAELRLIIRALSMLAGSGRVTDATIEEADRIAEYLADRLP